jgi:hypothetical protein
MESIRGGGGGFGRNIIPLSWVFVLNWEFGRKYRIQKAYLKLEFEKKKKHLFYIIRDPLGPLINTKFWYASTSWLWVGAHNQLRSEKKSKICKVQWANKNIYYLIISGNKLNLEFFHNHISNKIKVEFNMFSYVNEKSN